jgi:hypothetical protein
MTELGGGINRVVRIGTTIRRPVGPWSSAVHELLRHLQSVNFTGAPRFLGIDEKGREILSNVVGRTPWPASTELVDMRFLASTAALLRGYHDAVAGWNPAGLSWQRPPVHVGNVEVICHNDVAPWNVMCDSGVATAFVDWDTAAPGSRMWDLSYLAYTFAPLADETSKKWMGWPTNTPSTERLMSIATAYGCERSQWECLLETLTLRVQAGYEAMRLWAAEDRPGWRAQWEQAEPWRHGAGYLRDLEFIERSLPHWRTLDF